MLHRLLAVACLATVGCGGAVEACDGTPIERQFTARFDVGSSSCPATAPGLISFYRGSGATFVSGERRVGLTENGCIASGTMEDGASIVCASSSSCEWHRACGVVRVVLTQAT